MTAFAAALQDSGLRPVDYCRAVTSLTGQKYSPVMVSRWISGMYDAPAPAIAWPSSWGGCWQMS